LQREGNGSGVDLGGTNKRTSAAIVHMRAEPKYLVRLCSGIELVASGMQRKTGYRWRRKVRMGRA
jgi:hypothetical protein